jgi:DNA-binding transcriptional MocR family regulator
LAIAVQWIQDGTAAAALAAIRRELAARQAVAARALAGCAVQTHPAAPHLWLTLPPGWSRAAFVERARRQGVAVLAADAFATTAAVPEAVRVCLGAARDAAELRLAMSRLQATLREAHSLGPAVV